VSRVRKSSKKLRRRKALKHSKPTATTAVAESPKKAADFGAGTVFHHRWGRLI